MRKYYFIIQHAKQKIDDDAANELAAKKAEKEKKAEKSKKKGKDKKAALELDKMTPQTDSIAPEMKGLIPGYDSIPVQKVIDTIPIKSVN